LSKYHENNLNSVVPNENITRFASNGYRYRPSRPSVVVGRFSLLQQITKLTLQGSAVTQTVLGGLICSSCKFLIVYTVYEIRLAELLQQ